MDTKKSIIAGGIAFELGNTLREGFRRDIFRERLAPLLATNEKAEGEGRTISMSFYSAFTWIAAHTRVCGAGWVPPQTTASFEELTASFEELLAVFPGAGGAAAFFDVAGACIDMVKPAADATEKPASELATDEKKA